MKITMNKENIEVLQEVYPNATNHTYHRFINNCVKMESSSCLARRAQEEKAKNFVSANNYSNEWYAIRDNIELIAKIESGKNILVGNKEISICVPINYAPYILNTIRCGIVKNSQIIEFMNFKGSINLKDGGFLDDRNENFVQVENGAYDIYTYDNFVVLFKTK